jgi:hypothetical protein
MNPGQRRPSKPGMRVLAFMALFAAACAPRVDFIPDGTPAYGHRINPADDVVVLVRPPAEPYHLVGHLAWRQWAWEDEAALRGLREEAGKAGCSAVVLPTARGSWAECVVLDSGSSR